MTARTILQQLAPVGQTEIANVSATKGKAAIISNRRFLVATQPYENALRAVESLSIEDCERLLGELTARLAKGAVRAKKHSIMEFRGLGKDIWKGIDAQEYVRNERASWDG
jgi:hypothetical protein